MSSDTREKSKADPKSDLRTGWGLVGPGHFAREFATELSRLDRARCVAVASRNRDRATAFANEFGFERAYGSYEELFADEEVEIVYVVVPHVFHAELSKQAIAAGKAVLCEKPLTPSLAESEDLVRFARERGVFLMEAMKTGFLPAIRRAADWIREGRIGEPRLAKADFCFRGPSDPEGRLFNPDLAGGAVLDVGIYPLHIHRFLLGEVEELSAFGHLAPTGVEDAAAFLTRHSSGAVGSSLCSISTEESMDATIHGTEADLRLPNFHAGTRIGLFQDNRCVDQVVDDSGGMVKAEIEAAMDALAAGLTECPGHRHEDSLALARWMDEIRRQVGSTLVGD